MSYTSYINDCLFDAHKFYGSTDIHNSLVIQLKYTYRNLLLPLNAPARIPFKTNHSSKRNVIATQLCVRVCYATNNMELLYSCKLHTRFFFLITALLINANFIFVSP